MAKAIDPTSESFIEGVYIPSGKYAGKTLGQAGSSLEGLVYLHNILVSSTPPSFMTIPMKDWINRFLTRPDREAILSCGISGQRKQKKAC